jgi:uncharacterized protein (TIGR03118 family)
VEVLEDRQLLSTGYLQIDLASDVPGLARATDPNLVNPWGLAFSPTGPFWFANNGTGVSDLLDGRGQPVPLIVAVPSATSAAGRPTGTVFNGGPGFDIWENGLSAPSRFLFATENGTISGWSAAVDPTRALTVVDNSASGAVYKGLALGIDSAGHRFLYAADFSHGTIAVFDQDFNPVALSGSFHDPNLPGDFAPFNVQNVNGLLFVTYALRGWNHADDVPGSGHGFIDVYDTSGQLVSRFASGGALNSPWGLSLAPADFGALGGDLLVGNNGDGHIDAYDPKSGAFLGAVRDDHWAPISIPGLWALTFGNGHVGGDANTLFFTAGTDWEAHGLFGAIQSPANRGADTAGPKPFDPSAPGEPGDYPIPPRDGPVLGVDVAARPAPKADLLPLRESALALVPTLITMAEADTSSAASLLQGVSASVHGSDSALEPASPRGSNSLSAESLSDRAMALGSFLDWRAELVIPDHARGPSAERVDARNGDLTDIHGEAEGAVSTVEAGTSVSRRDQGLPAAVEECEGALDAGRADQVGAVSSRADKRAGHGRNTLMVLLGFFSVPTMWAYCRRWRRSRDGSIDPGSCGFST